MELLLAGCTNMSHSLSQQTDHVHDNIVHEMRLGATCTASCIPHNLIEYLFVSGLAGGHGSLIKSVLFTRCRYFFIIITNRLWGCSIFSLGVIPKYSKTLVTSSLGMGLEIDPLMSRSFSLLFSAAISLPLLDIATLTRYWSDTI